MFPLIRFLISSLQTEVSTEGIVTVEGLIIPCPVCTQMSPCEVTDTPPVGRPRGVLDSRTEDSPAS